MCEMWTICLNNEILDDKSDKLDELLDDLDGGRVETGGRIRHKVLNKVRNSPISILHINISHIKSSYFKSLVLFANSNPLINTF